MIYRLEYSSSRVWTNSFSKALRFFLDHVPVVSNNPPVGRDLDVRLFRGRVLIAEIKRRKTKDSWYPYYTRFYSMTEEERKVVDISVIWSFKLIGSLGEENRKKWHEYLVENVLP